MRWGVVLLVVACYSHAADGVVRGNFLRKPDYATPGTGVTQAYFVDGSLGNDSNTCTASSASACLTIQGALNKAPRQLRDQVTVTIASGTYAGFIVSGFVSDVSFSSSAGLLIQGTLVTSTLASGSATGTATSGTAGSGATFGTLTDSGATWTVNDLRGRFITTVSPTNTVLPISSNTSTTITVEGLWNSPTGSTTYIIQDPGTIINTAVSRPANGFSASSANFGAIYVTGNNIAYRANTIGIQNLKLTNSVGAGIQIIDNSVFLIQQMQIYPSAATAQGLVVNGQIPGVPNGAVSLGTSSIQLVSSAAAVQSNSGYFAMSHTLVSNTGGTSVSPAIQLGNFAAGIVRLNNIGDSELVNFHDGLLLQNGSSTGIPGTPGLSHVQITCLDSTGVGITVGNPNTTTVGGMSALAGIENTNIATCGTGLQVVGYSQADIKQLFGSVATTAISVLLGGIVDFNKATTTITAGTNEINLDSGKTTGAFSDVAAGACLSLAQTGSKVCGR